MTKLIAILALLAAPALAAPNPAVSEINKTIDAWHQAISKADGDAYFKFFTDDAVFLGTDPAERWPLAEFRKWAHPILAKGKGWTIIGKDRHVFIAPGGKLAWFDEVADSKEMGPCRGSGVLVQDKAGKWKIAQYNLSIPVPNEKFDEVSKIIGKK